MVFWPWLPRPTDALWAVDGPTAVSWHFGLNVWLMLVAVLMGIYLPIRRQRLDRQVLFCWLLAAGIGLSWLALSRSAGQLALVFVEEAEYAISEGRVREHSLTLNFPGSGQPRVYRVMGGIRWPVYYQRLSDTQADVYTPWAFGRRYGWHINVQQGTSRL